MHFVIQAEIANNHAAHFTTNGAASSSAGFEVNIMRAVAVSIVYQCFARKKVINRQVPDALFRYGHGMVPRG